MQYKIMWKNVEKILKEKGMSIYKLSKITGIPDNTLRNYHSKHSDPSFTNACKIADALGISLDDLREKKR
ncbi:prophage protein [Lactobacillus amylovorus]|uniref:Prophage protein n=2 Tax=Lactobacillus amylovorus TaxID=1604 RepID=F0TFG6_LACAM|nr:prophage protein [Lactobacillus amylovorus]